MEKALNKLCRHDFTNPIQINDTNEMTPLDIRSRLVETPKLTEDSNNST